MTEKLSSYRPDIDGLRAVAVLLVLAFHAGAGCTGGFVGVDVFFVISGFLITGILLADLGAEKLTLLGFWERRIRRILPAAAVVLMASFAVGWFWLLPQDFLELGRSVMAQVLMVPNVYFYRTSGYFTQDADLKPLLHTWSLGVEEQFYVMLPFLLLMLRRVRRRSQLMVLAALGLGSLALSVAWSHSHAWANFFFLPTRAWELLLGSCLAAWKPGPKAAPRWLRECLGAAGLVMIFGSAFGYDEKTTFPGLAALLPCGGALLILGSARSGQTLTSSVLSWRPLVFVGLISYSLYLWHWPMLAFARYWAVAPLPWHLRGLLMLAALGLAVLSWRYVECPLRQRRVLRSRRALFTAAGAVTSLLLMAGLAVEWTGGMRSRLPKEVLQFADGSLDHRDYPMVTPEAAERGDFIPLGVASSAVPITLMVWGDSHAWAVMPALDELCQKHGRRAVAAVYPATFPALDYVSTNPHSLRERSPAFHEAVRHYIISQKIPDVLLVATWNGHFDEGNPDQAEQALITTVKTLKAEGVKVWLMKSVPTYPVAIPKALASAVIHGEDPKQVGKPLAEHLKASLTETHIFAKLAAEGAGILDPMTWLSTPEKRCRVSVDGHSLYRDHHHLTVFGAKYIAPIFEPIFESR
jgi:peptidoglycan/LPS O-acetylase OafA/YrhL